MSEWQRKTETPAVAEPVDCNPDTVADAVEGRTLPLLLPELVTAWPAVAAGTDGPRAMADYIRSFYSGEKLTVFTAPPQSGGRVGYDSKLRGFNFERASANLEVVLERMLASRASSESETVYVGSTLLDRWFPGFRAHNDLDLGERQLLASIWLGNRVRVSAHFDVADNIACCVAGRRKFTLFPPEQLENLYVGPWDVTPAGQAISLVDFDAPDFDKYPKFRIALEHSFSVTLKPGDALFIPGMWWHHVAGEEDFNVLVNYWWRSTPAFMGSPLNALKAALLSLHGLPPEQRAAWRNIFDHYVFERPADALAHIPEDRRGILEPTDDVTARQLRADLLNQLNR